MVFSTSANRKTTQLENFDKRKRLFSLQVHLYTCCGLPLAILSYPQMSDHLYLVSLIADNDNLSGLQPSGTQMAA
jgi:hypothetical protein